MGSDLWWSHSNHIHDQPNNQPSNVSRSRAHVALKECTTHRSLCVCAWHLSPKIQDPALMAARFIFFLRWFHCLSTLEGVFFWAADSWASLWDGYNKTLPNDQQTWWIEAWFPQAFQENTAETDNFKAHDSAGFWSFLRCETYKWYYWRSSQGPSTKHDPQKGGIHHANLAPHKFAHIIWWLQISKTLASDFWGWTKLSINSTPSNKRWGSFQQVLRNLQVSTLSSISPRLRELYKMESSTIVAPSTAPIEILR